MTTGQSFFPKDVKRHIAGGAKLVTRMLRDMYPDQVINIPQDRTVVPVGKVGWTVDGILITFSRLDLQFYSEEQFGHEIRKTIRAGLEKKDDQHGSN